MPTHENRPTPSPSVIDDYIISRNQVGGKLALATVTASAMGGWTLFNPPEAGSSFGGITAVLGYCLGTAVAVLVFAFVGPRLRQILPWGYSLNDYVRQRFTQKKERFAQPIYWLVLGVMLLYMFVYMAAELTTIVQVLKRLMSWPVFETSLGVMAIIFLYTVLGGIKATILTDAIQFLLIVPLIGICFVVTASALGGLGTALTEAAANSPALMSFSNVAGLRFGATLLIAITAAELFNQSNWQRVYACRDIPTVRRSFISSAIVIFPLILMAGLLGVMAVGQNFKGDTAFFQLFLDLQMPVWALFAVLMLALALVMSSIDSLLNAITSVFMMDFLRLSGQVGERAESQALITARVVTMATGLLAIAIAAEGFSVIYLFFVADLLCAGLAFPVIFSFYNRYQTATNAFWSSIIGIAVGGLFFPSPDLSPLFHLPGAGDLLNCFTVALLTSTGLTLFWTSQEKKNQKNVPFNYSELRKVNPYSQFIEGNSH